MTKNGSVARNVIVLQLTYSMGTYAYAIRMHLKSISFVRMKTVTKGSTKLGDEFEENVCCESHMLISISSKDVSFMQKSRKKNLRSLLFLIHSTKRTDSESQLSILYK